MNSDIQQKLEDIEELFIENLAENMRSYGIPVTVGRVLGVIYMNRAPMTLDELSTETGMSKTRMSQVVREMVDYNIANKVYEKGIRKDLYAVEEDFYQIFISLFTSSWQKVIHKNKRMGRKVYHELLELSQTDNLDDKTKQKLDELLSETKKWLDYHDWLDRFVDFLDNGKVFKYVPKT